MEFFIKTNQLSEADFSTIIDISNQQFGNDYLTNKELTMYVNNDSKFAITIHTKEDIVGFSLIQICNKRELTSLLLNATWVNSIFNQSSYPVGIIKTIAINNNYQNKSLGTKLLQKSITYTTSKSFDIISLCWKHKTNNAFLKLLTKFKFTEVKKIENFWQKDSLTKKYNCKVCGTPPCKCGMLLYKLK